MMDVFTLCQGNIYDPGNLYDFWNLVVSSNTNNRNSNTVIMCLVKLVVNNDVEEGDIPFDYYGTIYKIIPSCLINCSVKKATRYTYKGTLSKDIFDKVIDRIKSIFFDNPVYSIDEANNIIHEKEIALKAKYEQAAIADVTTIPTIENPITMFPKETNIKLTREDEERAFAHQLGDIEVETIESPNNTTSFSIDEIKVNKEIEILSPVEEKEIDYPSINSEPIQIIKPNKRSKHNALIYDNIEKFVSDYKTKSTEFILKKYNIKNKSILSKHIYYIRNRHPELFGIKSDESISYYEEFILDYYSLTDQELIDKYKLENSKAIKSAFTKAKVNFIANGGNKKDLDDLKQSSGRTKKGKRKVV